MTMINGRPAVKKIIRWPQGSVNHIDVTYFIVNSLNYITLNTFKTKHFESYNSFLCDKGFTCTEDTYPYKDKRHKKRLKYEHNEIAYDGEPFRVELFLYPDEFGWTGITTKIFYPTKEVLGWFIDYFSKIQMPKVSYIEFTFDLYTNQPQKLADLLNTYLHMQRNRQESNVLHTTFYQQKNPKSKGMKIYIKGEMLLCPVRLELTIRRRIIRALEISLDTLEEKLKEFDFSKYFSFKRLDKEKYIRALNRRSKQNFLKMKRNEPKTKRKLWTPENILALHYTHNRCGVEQWLEDDYDYSPRPVNNIKAEIKEIEKQYHRFLERVSELEEVFFSGINNQSFL